MTDFFWSDCGPNNSESYENLKLREMIYIKQKYS